MRSDVPGDEGAVYPSAAPVFYHPQLLGIFDGYEETKAQDY